MANFLIAAQTPAAARGSRAGRGGDQEAEGGGGGGPEGGIRGGGERAAGGEQAAGGEGQRQAGQGGGPAVERRAVPEGLAVRARVEAPGSRVVQAPRAARQDPDGGQEDFVQNHQDHAGVYGGK